MANNIFTPSQEISNLPCITDAQIQEETNLIDSYFKSLTFTAQLPEEFIQLIKDFFIWTQPIYGDPYTWDYFDLQDITLIDSSFDFSQAQGKLKHYQGDPDFGASVLHFKAHIDEDGFTIYDNADPQCELLINRVIKEWETFFGDPELDTEVIFDFKQEQETMTVFLICY